MDKNIISNVIASNKSTKNNKDGTKSDTTTSPVRSEFDPVDYSKQTEYRYEGLTVRSNDKDIIKRDERGNIMYYESGSDNKILVVETVRRTITKKSFLSTVDTNFEYFSFPAKIVPVAATADLNLDFGIEFKEVDPIFARYSPSERKPVAGPTGGDPPVASGIFLDNLVAGLPQTTPNAYTVSQIVKDSGKDLRVRANIRHSYVYDEFRTNPGYISFYVSRGGASGLNREFAGPFTSTTDGKIYDSDTYIVNIDFIIENKDFITGTTFGITAKTGQTSGHLIQANGTYFAITDATKNVNAYNEPE